MTFSCWRWSDASQADAEQSAAAAANQMLERFLAGREAQQYPYGTRPLREEIVESLNDAHGKTIGVVTRNQYGALVLNAPRVMFVDIDFPQVSAAEKAKGFFARLFGRGKQTRKPETPPAEQQAATRLAAFVAQRPSWGMRLYRTFAGLRAIVTHDVFEPTHSAAIATLEQLDADPLYVQLCRAQQCFRARLTPKPWRCGHWANRIRYPIENPTLARAYERWKAEYDHHQREYATCRWLGQIGASVVHPEVEMVVRLHDYVTRCHDQLPLA